MTEITNLKEAELWWASLTTETKIEVAQDFINNDLYDDDDEG